MDIHCDFVLDNPHKFPDCLVRFLKHHRAPAIEKVGKESPVCFATDAHGDRVRLVMASRLGDVGITTNLKSDQGYERRIFVEYLSDFSEHP